MQEGVYDEFRPYFQALEGLNTRRVSRFDAAYDDFHQTLKSSLGQPDALMSAAREAFDLFSPELGGSPRFQALLNVHEAGDPAAFEEAFRRDSDTPRDPPIQIDPRRPTWGIWGGGVTPAAQGPDISHKTQPMTVETASGRRIEGASQITVGDTVSWLDPSGEPMSADDPVVRVIDDQGGLSYTTRFNRAEAERQFPEALRQALARDWRAGEATYDQAIEKVRSFMRELGAANPGGADHMDPAVAIAYVKRLYDRPLTAGERLVMEAFERFSGAAGSDATGRPPSTEIE
jgi:hypothetical protein